MDTTHHVAVMNVSNSSAIEIRENIVLYKQVQSPYWWARIKVNGKTKRISTKIRIQDDKHGNGPARTRAFDIAQKLSLEKTYSSSQDDCHQNDATLKVVLDYHMAWKNRDIIEIMSLFHPDVTYYDFFTNRVMKYKDIPSFIQACLPKRPGERLTHTDRIRVDGHTAFIQYNLIMKEAHYRSSESITVKDGLIYEINEYGVLLPNQDGEKQDHSSNSERSASSRLGLSPKELANLSEDIDQYFKESKPFLDPDLCLQKVSDETGYSRNQISYFLNKMAGMTFYEFVHKARIEYILKISDEKSYQNIDDMAFEAGFNSMSAFYKHFKRITGLSPKAYLKKKQALA